VVAIKIVIAGFGNIARRHIRNLKKIAPEAEIGIWRQHSREVDLGDFSSFVSRVFLNGQDALAWKPDVALITNPAAMHVDSGLWLARAGVHLFVEKPLSHDLKRVDELIEVCRARNIVLMVGYGFRFYPPLQRLQQVLEEGRIGRPLYLRAEVGQYLPDWRPGSDYRESVSACQELGGGAVLELSHELDYACWMMGEVEAVGAMLGSLSNLNIDVEDTAEITLRFSGGAIGSIHMDMVQRVPVRTCRIAGTEGVLSWDISGHQAHLFTADVGEWEELHAELNFDFNQVYIEELKHFFSCVQKNVSPLVGGDEGRKIMEVILAAKRSALEGREIQL
jgi:predicted dehydrogenase